MATCTTTPIPARTTSRTDEDVCRYLGMCFAVAAPGSGSYTLTMHESRSKASGTFKFVIP